VPGEAVREDKDKKIKYYWSDLPADTPLARLVELLHRRPGIERGYQDGKDVLYFVKAQFDTRMM
jgi:hypothetical protein